MQFSRLSKVPARAIPAVTALFFLILRTTSAQAPAPQAASQVTPQIPPPTTTIKVATRLVIVEVIVQDKKNQPVPGLTKDDFELLEDDQPQTISVFSVEGRLAPRAPSPAPLMPLPLNTFTNRPNRPSEVPTSATVILLDGLNTNASDLAMARLQVGKFLEKLQPQDHVALYVMGHELKMIHDFTNDSASLLQALKDLRPECAGAGGPNLSSISGSDPRLDPTGGDQRLTYLLNLPYVDISVGAFRAMGERLAGLPGRKTLIWISRGFPLLLQTGIGPQGQPDLTDMTAKVREVSQVLSKYNVAVYPMDTRGLNVGANSIDSVSATATPGAQSVGSMYDYGNIAMSQNQRNKTMQDAHDSGRLLARLTGGRTYYDQNDLDYGIRSAIDDSKLVYVLGYYPAQDKWDSQFHTFKVRVKESGMKLTYRSGYLAVPEEPALSADDAQKALEKAALDPLDSTAIGLTASIQKEGANSQSLTINLRVDVNDLTLVSDSNLWKGSLEVVIAQLTSERDMPANGGRHHTVQVNLPEDAYTRLKADGLQLYFPFNRDPQAVQARVVVRDTTSGALGTVSIPFDKI